MRYWLLTCGRVPSRVVNPPGDSVIVSLGKPERQESTHKLANALTMSATSLDEDILMTYVAARGERRAGAGMRYRA